MSRIQYAAERRTDEDPKYVCQQTGRGRNKDRVLAQQKNSDDPLSVQVAHLADKDAGDHGRAAREYLDALGKRREIVANSTAKYQALTTLAPTIRDADGALVFTETVKAANHAINRLDTELDIEIITGDTPRAARETILDRLRTGSLDAVAAPRVLDEGVDVPNANLGVARLTGQRSLPRPANASVSLFVLWI